MTAFRDEVEKIAYVRQAIRAGVGAFRGGAGVRKSVDVGRKAARFGAREAKFSKNLARRPNEGVVGHAMRKGWADVGGVHGSRGGWYGAKDTWREKLPVGGKTMTVGFTAAGLPSALKKEDPTGRGRSRAERLAQLGAGTLGGIAGVGAVMKGKSPGLLRSMVGGFGGGIAAEHAASLPFRQARKQRLQGGPLSREDRATLMQRAMPSGATQ